MLYLQDATFLDSSTFAVTRGDIAVEEGPCGSRVMGAAIPPVAERASGDRVIRCNGRLVVRSLACGHHHIYSALSRGMPPAPRTPANFLEVLKLVWWRLDKCLDKDMIAASALAAGLHMAKNGVTFCIDHHSSPQAVRGSLETIAGAFDRIGIGHLLCYEISCRDGKAVAQQGLEEHEAFLSAGGHGHVGLHASFTVSDGVLRDAVALARKHHTGVHIHAAEAKADQEHCLAAHGKTVVRRLQDAGALDLPQTILAHCVHVSEEDKRLLSDSPCWIVQNAESNMNNNVGIAGYGYSANVMYGTDGMHSDMVRSARSAYFAGIGAEGLNFAAAWERLRNVHRHIALHDAPGDGPNNLMILNYDSPTPLLRENALGHIFHGWDAKHVDTVISQGRIIVENGRLTSCDEADILAFADTQAKRLWRKLV